MAMCKKLFLISDGTNSNVVFLESRFNYFTKENDWFLVRITNVMGKAERVEKKISKEQAMLLLEMAKSLNIRKD
jgi:predicted nucleic acid-binding protein